MISRIICTLAVMLLPGSDAAIITVDTVFDGTNTVLTTDHPGIEMRGGATATLDTGALIQKNDSSGDDIGLRLGTTTGSESGFLVLNDGDIRVTDGDSGAAVGIDLYGVSIAQILGGLVSVTESDSRGADGFHIYDSAMFSMLGGSLTVAEAGGGAARAFQAFNNSVVNVSGGIIDVMEAGNGSLRPFDAFGNAAVNISGGDWQFSGSVAAFRTFDNAAVSITGTGFNYSAGLIGDTTGTISGTLADGNPFSFPFDRRGASTITLIDTAALVPEPSTYAIAAVLALMVGLRYRQERRQGRC